MSSMSDWFQGRLHSLGRNEATLLGVLFVSSRRDPGPWHRRQLFSQLTTCEAGWGLNPQTHQDSIQQLRDMGYLAHGACKGDWITNRSAFDWIEQHFRDAPAGSRPIPGSRLFGTTYGEVFGSEYAIHYERGEIVAVEILGRWFECPKHAVDALREAGVYFDGRWRNWNPPDLLEAHLVGHHWL